MVRGVGWDVDYTEELRTLRMPSRLCGWCTALLAVSCTPSGDKPKAADPPSPVATQPSSPSAPPSATSPKPATPAAASSSQPGESADQVACSKGEGAACFRMGERASLAKDTEGQLRYYTLACEAQVGLACVHLGRSVEPDPTKREEWLKKAFSIFEQACAKKDGEGCYYEGISLERGLGTGEDHPRSLAAYTKGCGLGNLLACCNEAGMPTSLAGCV